MLIPVADVSTQPELAEIRVFRSCIPRCSDQIKGRPITSRGEGYKPKTLGIFNNVSPEDPMTCPKRFIFDAALDTSGERVPKSRIPPLGVHRTACTEDHPGLVVDQPTTCPRSLTPFAELP